jgi:hypothetical protein
MLSNFRKYLLWALFQQAGIVIVFTSLLLVLNKPLALLLSIILFTMLHYPNLFLMVTTLVIEAIFLWLYAGIFSLIWMTITHSILAVVINKYVPEKITKGMRVLLKYR